MKTESFCSQCGARQRPGAAYCAACGTPVSGGQARSSSRPPARNARRSRPKGANLMLPLLIAGTLLVLAGAILLSQGQDRGAPTADPASVAGLAPTAGGAQTLPYPDVPRVTAADARARAQSGQAILVDVRSQEEYDAGHAQGARLLTDADLETGEVELPENAEIITYCT